MPLIMVNMNQAAKGTARLLLTPTTPVFLLTTAEAAGAFEGEGAAMGDEAGMVMVLKTIVGLAVAMDVAVTVTSGALLEVAEGCCCALGEVMVIAEVAEAGTEVEAEMVLLE